jgi:hypothetical protein
MHVNREEICKYSRGVQTTQEGAWRYVLSQRKMEEIDGVYQLYALSQLIPTQSADVERGFSLVNNSLGLNRLRTKTSTLDSKLRIQENLPSGKTDFEEKIEYARIGEEREKDDTETVPNAIAIYHQLMMPTHQPLMVQRLHEALLLRRACGRRSLQSSLRT